MGDYFGYTPSGANYTTSSSSYSPAGYGSTTEEVVTTTNTYTTPVTNTQVIGGGIETNFGTNVADGFFGGGQAAVSNAAAAAVNYNDYGGDGFFGGGASQVVTTVEQPTTIIETRQVEPISTTVTTNYSTPVNYGNYNAYDDYSANLYDYNETPKPASCCNLRNICLGLLGLLLLGALLGGLIGLLRFFLKGRNSQTIPSYLIPEEVPQIVYPPVTPPPIVFPTPPTVVVVPPVVPDIPITPLPPVVVPDVPIVTPLVAPGSTTVISTRAVVLPYNVTTTTTTIRPPSTITLRPIKVNPIIVPSKPIVVPTQPDVLITTQPDVLITTQPSGQAIPQLTAGDIQQLLLIQSQYGAFNPNVISQLGISEAQYRLMIQNANQAGLIAPSQLDLLSLPQAQADVAIAPAVATLTPTDVQQLLFLAQQNGGINASILSSLNLSEANYQAMISGASKAGLISAADYSKLALPSTGSKFLSSLGNASSKIGNWMKKGNNLLSSHHAVSSNSDLETLSDIAAPLLDRAEEPIF